MSTSINQLINANQPSTTGTTAATPTTSSSSGTAAANISSTEFLQLLTAQLQNQDPTKPMDDTQSVAELAQFTALQSQTQLATSFSNFQSNFAVTQAAGLIGKGITATTTSASGNTSSVSGTVSAVNVINGTPSVTITDSNGNVETDANGNPLSIPTTSITGIQ